MNRVITKLIRPALALGVALGLSACASVDSVDYNTQFETASRAAPVTSTVGVVEPEPVTFAAQAYGYKVMSVNVSVPNTLRVNEANRYYPGGDIVWREDPIGNRYEQVKAIVANALLQGAAKVEGDREVHLDVVVKRFHALTEKARYTVGGVHAISFDLRLRDAATGAILVGPKEIRADFDALGGHAAVRAEARGVTQKVRITNHLAFVIYQELTSPEGFVEYDLGLMGVINRL